MEEHQKIIVVPWDFTPVAEHALAHAVKISRMVGNDICLLHIVDPGIKTSVLGEKKILLQHVADENGKKYNLSIASQIYKGSIFTSIAEFVNEKDASLVVMGTHGMKGMQKLTGSWALKVIVKSKVPFIVVQDPPPDQGRYHNIVFPVDFRRENKEKTKMAIYMGKYFDSKMHILVTTSTDQSLVKKTKINLSFAIKYLIQNNIDYEIHEVPKGNFAQQTLDFAQKINADLILIVTTKNITFADYMLGASEQYIIANSSKIPVCCVNPKASFAKSGQFMGGWGD
ncbi:MAG TPA: universal stress protein [Bacteroidales bacterium]|jgi:nucleotide-binding universal stress UspA family protein|nr:universal stress protein [Bacteroidales bacterium]NMD02430.1 universal stress protein [Bacteroidales bacterium]OQB61346.1 MAG: Universal stress protein family protein [Bacteroidetes bacterium ADurb.Bin145]HQG63309.1 universal stress protein [Bacteroidales bacterium]